LLKNLGAKNYRLYVIPGEGHEYTEYQELTQAIINFLKDRNLIN